MLYFHITMKLTSRSHLAFLGPRTTQPAAPPAVAAAVQCPELLADFGVSGGSRPQT